MEGPESGPCWAQNWECGVPKPVAPEIFKGGSQGARNTPFSNEHVTVSHKNSPVFSNVSSNAKSQPSPPISGGSGATTSLSALEAMFTASRASDDLERIMGKCPTAEVLLAGLPVNCILDTGAETSLVSYEFFSDRLEERIDNFDLVGQFVNVVGANELAIPVIGVIDVPITVGNHTIDGSLLVRDECVSSSPCRSEYPVIYPGMQHIEGNCKGFEN